MQDKLWVVYERPRWPMGFLRSDGELDISGQKDLGSYLCSVGSLDVFRADHRQVRVAQDPKIKFGHNYTLLSYNTGQDRDVPLVFTDGDVAPTPFEMCALYQMAPLLWDLDWRPYLTENRV